PDSLQNKAVFYNMYNNLAIIYDFYGLPETSGLYEKSLSYYLSRMENDVIANENYYITLNNLAVWHSEKGNKNLALAYYLEIIEDAKSPPIRADAYNNYGYYLQQVPAAQKLKYFQLAINIILELDQSEQTAAIPSFEVITDTYYVNEIRTYLTDMATHLVKAYHEEKELSYLLKAREVLAVVDQLISLLRYESNNEQSKLFWINRGVDTYLLAVEVSFLLNAPDEAFYYMEKNKGLLLQENIKTIQAKQETKVPSELLEREYNLHYELQTLDQQYSANPDDPEVIKRYNAINLAYVSFMDSLGVHFPDYVKLKADADINTLEVGKELLKKENSCLLEYIIGDEKGYGIFIEEEKAVLFEIADVATLKKNIRLLKSYISKPILGTKELSTVRKTSHDVFVTLLPFENASALIGERTLYIAADNYLLNFPFETLLTDLAANLAESYLIRQIDIAYTQSVSSLYQIGRRNDIPAGKILGIAPVTFNSDSLNDLNGSVGLMKSLASYMQTDILMEEEATKNQFFTKANEYELIHINTHAGLDPHTLQ
ncbi:MAG: CHAT domain-containing protein, partial [Cyclobacteriaceae bacterium]